MDFKNFYDELLFDIDQPVIKSLKGKQGDTKSRGLYVKVMQKNAIVNDLTGLSMRLFYEKPDGTRGFIDGVVDNNQFRIDFTNQIYAVPGVVKAELRLSGSNGEVISLKTFKILVESSIADGSIVSQDERGILDRAFELAEDIIPRIELLDIELLENVQSLVQNMQNEQAQDRVTIAQIQQEFNTYKAIMSQINVNQEAKQQASGHGIVSLPQNAAEGQISVTLKGNTYFNSVINGNFAQGITGWQGNAATISAVNNILSVTGDGTSVMPNVMNASSYRTIIGRTGKKIFLRAKARVTNSVCNSLDLYVNPTGGADILYAKTIAVPVQNQWYDMFGIVTLTAGYENKTVAVHVCHRYPDTATANGKVMEVREILAIDLDQYPELANLTADQINARIPYWFDSAKSTISAGRVKSVGKNLIPNDISKFDYKQHSPIVTIEGDYIGIQNDISHDLEGIGYTISAFPGQIFSASAVVRKVSGSEPSRLLLEFLDKAKNSITYHAVYTNSTTDTILKIEGKIAPEGTAYVRLCLFAQPTGKTLFKNWQLEYGSVATTYEPYKETTAYLPNLTLRSLPNGVKDEINVTQGKFIKRVSDEVIIDGNSGWDYQFLYSPATNTYRIRIPNWSTNNNAKLLDSKSAIAIDDDGGYVIVTGAALNNPAGTVKALSLGDATAPNLYVHFPETLLEGMPSGVSLNGAKEYLNQHPITLIYQLATPVEIPVQVSGTLVGYSSGTVYWEPMVADAGVYAGEMDILNTSLPIKRIEKLSKVDYQTGLEYELDPSQAIISPDGLSFTHPGLSNGDIVFFIYEYSTESTKPEITVTYYDSRYVVQGPNGKFYKWFIEVKEIDGQMKGEIKLVEVV